MLNTTSFTSSSTILQSSIDVADEDEVGGSEIDSNETRILLTSFMSKKKLIGVSYLTSDTKKTFNLLRHAFTQAFILQYFDSKQYI